MRTLAIDIETYSSVSLQKCGVYAYAQSPDFEILLFGYAWDDGPVEVIDLARGESLPEELQNALYDPEILKTAFNASFERTCLSAFMGRVTPPEQWSCTAVMARELGPQQAQCRQSQYRIHASQGEQGLYQVEQVTDLLHQHHQHHDQARQRGHHGLLLPAASHQQQIQHRHQDTDGRYFENQVNIHCLSLTEVK